MMPVENFIISFISTFLAITLGFSIILYYFSKKLKKVVFNDALHAVAPIIIQANREMGESIGKKIWRQERSNKGVEARQQKRELTQNLEPVLGAAAMPLISEGLNFIPEKWRPLAVSFIQSNPELIQGIMANLGQMGGGQPHGGGKSPPMAQGFPSQRPPQLGLKKLQ